MRSRRAFLFVCAAGYWLGLASGCSPEYELLGSADSSAAIGGGRAVGGSFASGGLNLAIGAAGNATAASNAGGAEAIAEGGESALGGFDSTGKAGSFEQP